MKNAFLICAMTLIASCSALASRSFPVTYDCQIQAAIGAPVVSKKVTFTAQDAAQDAAALLVQAGGYSYELALTSWAANMTKDGQPHISLSLWKKEASGLIKTNIAAADGVHIEDNLGESIGDTNTVIITCRPE